MNDIQQNGEFQEITLKLDKRTLNYLRDDILRKRSASQANTFSDKFLIRLMEAINNNSQNQVFKIKDNNLSVRSVK